MISDKQIAVFTSSPKIISQIKISPQDFKNLLATYNVLGSLTFFTDKTKCEVLS
jgi:hypothetical protein